MGLEEGLRVYPIVSSEELLCLRCGIRFSESKRTHCVQRSNDYRDFFAYHRWPKR